MKRGEDYTGISVVFLCHDGKGNILLNKRSTNCRDEHGTWDPGAGAVDFGDSLEETLKKEIREEYCTDVLGYDFMGFREVSREHEGRKTHWIAFDFKVLVDRAKVAIGEPHKCDELRWVTLDTFPAPLHSQFPHFLEKYKDILRTL